MPSPSVSNVPKLFCPTCGKRIHPQSRFCRHCGSTADNAKQINEADDFILPNDDATDSQKTDATGTGAPSVAQQRLGNHQPNTANLGAPPLSEARDGRYGVDQPTPEQQLFQTARQRDEAEAQAPAEQNIWQGRPAWRAFAGSWCAWLAICAAVLTITFMYNNGGGPLVQAVWVFVGGSAAGLFARTALFVYGSRYRLTTERLFIHRGILLRITDQIELIRVDDVRIRQNIIDRLLNTGTLDVFSSDETDDTIQLFKISDPATVAEHVRNHTRAVRQQHAVAVERI